MRKIFTLVIFIVISASAFSQKSDSNIYSGGMLILQPGFTITKNSHQSIRDMSFGLGGILRFYFKDWFTAGVYGGTQKTKYSSSQSDNSYISLGFGGVFLGVSHKTGRFRYTASAFAGGGTIKNLHIEVQNDSRLTEAWFNKHSTIVISPIMSLDFAMSQRLMLTLQAVCLNAKTDHSNFIYNPTLQLGILFNR